MSLVCDVLLNQSQECNTSSVAHYAALSHLPLWVSRHYAFAFLGTATWRFSWHRGCSEAHEVMDGSDAVFTCSLRRLSSEVAQYCISAAREHVDSPWGVVDHLLAWVPHKLLWCCPNTQAHLKAPCAGLALVTQRRAPEPLRRQVRTEANSKTSMACKFRGSRRYALHARVARNGTAPFHCLVKV